MKHLWLLLLVASPLLLGCGDNGNGGDESTPLNATDHEQNDRLTGLEDADRIIQRELGLGFQRSNDNFSNDLANQLKGLKTALKVELRREEIVVAAGGVAPQGGKELFKEAWRELREEEELDEFRQQKEAERTSDALLDALRRRDQEKAAAECIPLSSKQLTDREKAIYVALGQARAKWPGVVYRGEVGKLPGFGNRDQALGPIQAHGHNVVAWRRGYGVTMTVSRQL